MQFKNLDENGYKRVCEFIASKAKGVVVSDDCVCLKRSGLSNYFMFSMLHQVIIEKDFADFCMGSRPFCNIRVALKVDKWNELVDLYKATMERGQAKP